MSEINLEYMKLDDSEAQSHAHIDSSSSFDPKRLVRWIQICLLIAFSGACAAVFFKWVGPFFMEKVIIPSTNWIKTSFTTPTLAVIIFFSVAFFPSLLLPSSPSMWLAGMVFGYSVGFLLIITASAIGVSVPYFIGSFFYRNIEFWLEKYPTKASALRSAGEGDWFHQFRAVILIRVSPFPYVFYNYCAVATHVQYSPYILGSLAGMVPEVLIAIYTGILIRTLTDASHNRHYLSVSQLVFNVLGFCSTVAVAIFFTIHAKRKLGTLRNEANPLIE